MRIDFGANHLSMPGRALGIVGFENVFPKRVDVVHFCIGGQFVKSGWGHNRRMGHVSRAAQKALLNK